jgi:hypothetical protein
MGFATYFSIYARFKKSSSGGAADRSAPIPPPDVDGNGS